LMLDSAHSTGIGYCYHVIRGNPTAAIRLLNIFGLHSQVLN
jgi:hypothetical protein